MMANREHLKILRQGVEVWSDWRVKQRGTTPDFAGANLYRESLRWQNLSGANLNEAHRAQAPPQAED
jgi:uncharacterized protein YjbI with pentapeptide repeats